MTRELNLVALGSVPRSVALCLVLAGFLVPPLTSRATSIDFAKFSAPILQDERLIFTSPDAKRLLCVNLQAELVWQRKYDFPVRLFTGPQAESLLQTGAVVSFISPESGALRARFTVEDANDGVNFSSKLNTFISQDLRFKKRMFKLLDPNTGKALWRTAEIESAICATPELVVGLAVERISIGKGYRFGKASLDAYHRRDFTRAWSVPLPDESGVPYLPAVFSPPYLIYTEGRTSLAVLDCTTGRKRLTKQMEVPQYGWISELKMKGDQLVWLTHKSNRNDFNSTEHLLHFCTIPELIENKQVILKLIEIAHISFEGGFIISDALYRTACFKPEGEKVWERFQSARSPVINNRIYFSDYHKETARLGVVEVATGNETILYSEKIEAQKR